jgi:glycerol kinase
MAQQKQGTGSAGTHGALMSILAIDAGTTGVTVLVVSAAGEITSRGYSEFEQHFPKPGWVEHDPEQIWQATLRASRQALNTSQNIEAIGVSNQRETLVLWDRETLKAPRNAIVWQDRRTADIVQELKDKNLEQVVRDKTGTNLDPYFTSTKLLWLQRNEPYVWQSVVDGKTVIGTVDSYLVARLTSGESHITDASNASRTQLCNIESATWDDELLTIFNVPRAALATIGRNYGNLAETDPQVFLGIKAPITGMAGDQQAALFGQSAFDAGDSKCTYGTGAFLLTNTGTKRVSSSHGLITTIAWQSPDGEITYALEGSVFVAGSAVQWLRDGLKIIKESKDVEELANEVSDAGGVTFIPALTGLGAPYWKPDVRGTIVGITRGTTDGHIARATLEAVAFQVTDLVRAMEQDLGQKTKTLRVDGGMCKNNLLLQIQADDLSQPVERGGVLESTGLGAAYLAGLGAGIFESKQKLKNLWTLEQIFTPKTVSSDVHERWRKAVDSLTD